MAQRGQWQDVYAWTLSSLLSDGTSNISAGVDNSGDDALAGILFNSHPDLKPNQETIDTEKTSGSASRISRSGGELAQGSKKPSVSYEFDAAAKTLYLPLHVTLQRGSVDESADGVSDVKAKWFYPYSYEGTPVSPEIYAILARRLAPNGSPESHRMDGMIGSTLTLSADGEDSALVCSGEMLGRDVDTSYSTTVNDSFNFTPDSHLLWKDATTKIGDGTSAMEDVDLDGFSITLNINPVRKLYSNALTQKYLMGKLVAEGTIKVPWTNSSSSFTDNILLERFVAGTPTRFSIYWGNQYPSSNNDVSINFIARFTGADVGQDEDEIGTDLPFMCTEHVFMDGLPTGINNISGVSYVDPTLSVTGSGLVATGNVFPGDAFESKDASAGQNVLHPIVKVTAGSSPFDVGLATGTTITSPTSVSVLMSQPFSIGVYDNLDRSADFS